RYRGLSSFPTRRSSDLAHCAFWAIVDTFSRFSPAVDPWFSYRGEDVVTALERVCRDVGYPQSIRVDQGSEFISRGLDLWAYQKGDRKSTRLNSSHVKIS